MQARWSNAHMKHNNQSESEKANRLKSWLVYDKKNADRKAHESTMRKARWNARCFETGRDIANY